MPHTGLTCNALVLVLNWRSASCRKTGGELYIFLTIKCFLEWKPNHSTWLWTQLRSRQQTVKNKSRDVFSLVSQLNSQWTGKSSPNAFINSHFIMTRDKPFIRCWPPHCMERLKGKMFQVLQTPPAGSFFIIKPAGSSGMNLANRSPFLLFFLTFHSSTPIRAAQKSLQEAVLLWFPWSAWHGGCSCVMGKAWDGPTSST